LQYSLLGKCVTGLVTDPSESVVLAQ